MNAAERARILARDERIEKRWAGVTSEQFTRYIIADARRKGTLKETEPEKYPVATMRELAQHQDYMNWIDGYLT